MGDKKKRKKETQPSDSHENEIAVLSSVKKMKKKKLKQKEDDVSDLAEMQNGEISDKNSKKLKKRNKSKEKSGVPEEVTLQSERTDDVAHQSDRTAEEPIAMPTKSSSISQDINDCIGKEKKKKKKRKRDGREEGINDKKDHNAEEIKDETVCVEKKSKDERFGSVESIIHSSQLGGEDKGKNNYSNSSTAFEVSNSNEHLETKKEKKKKIRNREEKEEGINDKKDHNIEDIEDETVCIRIKKKKKKKKKSEAKDEPLVTSIQSSQPGGEDKGKDNSPRSIASLEVSNEHLETKEKKKKKTKHKKQNESCTQLEIPTLNRNKIREEDELESKPDKKKLKRKRQLEDTSISDKEQEEDFKKKKKKKTKKKVIKGKDDISIYDENHVTMTFKSDLLKDEGSGTVKKNQFSQLSGKSASLDGIPITKADTAKETESSVQTVAKGQWEGAMFVSDERQSKFLRLLGGMKAQNNDRKKLFSSGNSSQKKGLFGSLSASVPSSSPNVGNKALSLSEAAAMDKRLEEDYNRAMNFKLSGKKSAGLGFTPDPAEGKKFHIDANASKSLKFDDD